MAGGKIKSCKKFKGRIKEYYDKTLFRNRVAQFGSGESGHCQPPKIVENRINDCANLHIECSFSYTCDNILRVKPCYAVCSVLA